MSEGTGLEVEQLFLPFAVLSEKRTEPFTPEMEAATVFALAEFERNKGKGLIAKQPEEKIEFIAKIGYPLWLFPWSDILLVFDGLKQTSHTMKYLVIPDVYEFREDLERGARTLETHSAFLSDNLSYFKTPITEKGLFMIGLMQDTKFLTEFSTYRRDAKKTSENNLGLLAPKLDETTISSAIYELEELHSFLQTNDDNLCGCIKLLNKVTHQYTKEIGNKIRDVKEDFESKIKEEEEETVAPRIKQLKDEYDFRINSLAKNFEKQRLPIQREKTTLEKSKENAVSRIEHYKMEAKALGDKGQIAAEQKWREKASKTRKELSEIENQLRQSEKALKGLEEKRSVEIFNLREELEAKIIEARKNLLELEASRDAKILIHNQEIEKLEKQTNEISEQINNTIRLLEASLIQFTNVGVKKELGPERECLYYMPFYVVCFKAESKKRYMVLPPAVINTVGVFTKLKGALGMTKTKQLLSPRFKTVIQLFDSVQLLVQQNAAFETEINTMGARNNMLSDNMYDDIKNGLRKLRSEGWLSDKEFEAVEQRIS